MGATGANWPIYRDHGTNSETLHTQSYGAVLRSNRFHRATCMLYEKARCQAPSFEQCVMCYGVQATSTKVRWAKSSYRTAVIILSKAEILHTHPHYISSVHVSFADNNYRAIPTNSSPNKYNRMCPPKRGATRNKLVHTIK